MANLEVLQLVVDGLLVLSLFYLCVRSAKASPFIQSGVLESGLRRMVQEADLATRTLQEKLVQRQTRLEELLLDLESAENRLNRSKQSIEETKADLDARFIKAQRALQTLQNQIDNVPQTIKSNLESVAVKNSEIEKPVADETKENPLDRDYAQLNAARENVKKNIYGEAVTEKSAAPKANVNNGFTQNYSRSSVKRSAARTNIYGEVIAPKENTANRSALSAKVEKEVYQPQKQNSLKGYNNNIENVYDEAENLLKAGNGVDYVAALTDLPVEEVKMLSQVLERVPQHQQQVQTKNEYSPIVDSATAIVGDSRLGALDPIRRQIQTI